MRIKSYFAATIEGAMRTARRELGDEAMLVQSRKSMPEAQHLGAYEVVFAVEDPSETSKVLAREPSGETGILVRQLAGQFRQMRRQMDHLSSALTLPQARPDPGNSMNMHPWVEAVYRELLLTDLSPGVARKVVDRLDVSAIAAHPDATRRSVARELERLVQVSPQLAGAPSPERPRVAAVIGPPGAGKTSVLVKIAARYGFGPRRPCQLLSVDTNRIGSAEQLRSFAAILGMGCQTLDSVQALELALEENTRSDLVLIDTPGYGAREIERTTELAAFFAASRWIDKHLVLNATSRTSDLERSIERFARFGVNKLIFTHLDESVIAGNILTVAVESGMPISFLSAGQEIPDDLEEASKPRLVDLVLSSMMDEDFVAGRFASPNSPAREWAGFGERKEDAERTMATA
ncbi:MAG: hypothetical protein ACKV22_38410 [Bryobacteraceae bacterium]